MTQLYFIYMLLCWFLFNKYCVVWGEIILIVHFVSSDLACAILQIHNQTMRNVEMDISYEFRWLYF